MAEIASNTPYYRDATSSLFQAEGNIVAEGKGLRNEWKVARANPDSWGKDIRLKADYMLAYDAALKDGNLPEKTVENGIVADIREKAPELQDILVKEYGRDWQTRAPEGVIAGVWRVAEQVNKKEVHGYEVNRVLREYWETPKYREETGERIYLPENKRERRELMGRAQYYNRARVEARIEEMNLVAEIVLAKEYHYDDLEVLRKKLIEQWQKEDAERSNGCIYKLNGDVQELKIGDVQERVQNFDTPELLEIVQKIVEIANVKNNEDLLREVGVISEADGGYRVANMDQNDGVQWLVLGRMGQQELMRTCTRCLEGIAPGSEKNADILLANAIGMETLASTERTGKTIIEGDIYMQRGRELTRRVDEQGNVITREIELRTGSGESGEEKISFMYETMKQVNEVLYMATAAATNAIRMKTIGNNKLRKMGEKLSGWIDRVSVWGAPKMEKFLAKKIKSEPNDLRESEGTMQRGKVNLNLPNI